MAEIWHEKIDHNPPAALTPEEIAALRTCALTFGKPNANDEWFYPGERFRRLVQPLTRYCGVEVPTASALSNSRQDVDRDSYPRRALEQQYLRGRFRISETRISKLLDVDIKSHDLIARYLHLPANADRARAEAKRAGVEFEDWGQVIYEIGCAEFVAQGEAFGSYGIHEHPITRRQLFVEQFPGKLTELATALAASPHMTTFLASQELGSGVQLVIDHTTVAGFVGCSVSDWINDWRHCALRAAILKAIEIVRASPR